MSSTAQPRSSKVTDPALTPNSGRDERHRFRCWAAGLLLFVFLSVGLAAVVHLPRMADEAVHVDQIRTFTRGDWTLNEWLTTPPGYHVLVAGISRIVGRSAVPALRSYSFMLSIALLLVLFLLCRDVRDGRTPERILQIAFLPTLFPLFFLIYTDVASMLFVVLALLLHERRRYWLAGVAGFFSLLVRQSNIVWVGYLLVLLAIRLHDVTPVAAGGTAARRRMPRLSGVARAVTTRGATYILTIAAFLAFVLVNGGVAIGDRDMHPLSAVHFSNIYFALFITFVLFLPLHLVQLREIRRLFYRTRTLVGVAVFVPFFLYTFTPDHPYNQLDFWLHNRLLIFFSSSTATKLLMLIPVLVALLSLYATRFRGQSKHLFYAFSGMSLLPVWHVEQRYYLIPMVLFLLFREQRTLRFEWTLVAYLGALAATLLSTIRSGALFL
jgi:alpha-1,2-glucosyltransferase